MTLRRAIPIYDATAPIACTASPADLSARLDALDRLRAALRSVERTADGVLLRFPKTAGVDAEVRQFTVDEKACCPFWGFEVRAGRGELVLRWDGPPSVSDWFDDLVELLRSDQPLRGLPLL